VQATSTDRRRFLKTISQAGAIGTLWATSASAAQTEARRDDVTVRSDTSWDEVRRLFELRRDRIHMAGMVMASHPVPVTRAIETHRLELQRDPVRYIDENRWRLEGDVLKAAAHYLNAAVQDIALTDSTSMGLGLLYTGLRLDNRHEILTTTHDHYATETAIAACADRTGCSVRRVPMYRDLASVTSDELVDSIRGAVSAKTRVVAVTWVHSSTGLKIPIRRIGDLIQELNARRAEQDRIYFCVDGVHALGIEDFTLPDLNCDFWVAGTHKWLFGPRGTGVLWGRANAWTMTRPTIPTWEPAEFQAWIGWRPKSAIGGGQLMTPGGYHSFDHRWALGSAFELHERLGKARVQTRIHSLNRQLKEGLRKIKGVQLYTPMSEALSSGIVCFDVGSLPAQAVVDKLFDKGIVASRTPYKASFARLCPSLLTLESDVERTLQAVATLTV
jgi:selenocysteine lyase/cysteine desulfurase